MDFVSRLSGSRVFVAFLVNILFFCVLCFFTPLIHSQGDVFTMYVLSGGFGNATNLLHFDHIYHPWLTHIIQQLFALDASINWYSWLLIVLLFFSFWTILIAIFEKEFNTKGLIFYSVIFGLYGTLFLLYLSINHVVVALIVSSLILVLPTAEKINFKKYTGAILLLIIASSLRIHLVVFILVILCPLLFVFFKKKAHFFLLLLVFLAVPFLLNQAHKSYYTKAIPEWKKEETRRQNLYHFYNQNYLLDTAYKTWNTERVMISNAMVWDTTFLSNEKLVTIANDIKEIHRINDHKPSAFKALSTNNKLYFISCFVVALFFATRRMLLPLIVVFTSVLVVGFSLVIYFKMPGYYLKGAGLAISLFIYLLSSKEIKRPAIYFCIFSLLIIWSLVIAINNNQTNVAANALFRSTAKEIGRNKKNIFLIVDNKFTLKNFYAFDKPADYPLPNILMFDHYHSNMYKDILNRFSIKDMPELMRSNTLLLWGSPPREFLDYLAIAYNLDASFSEPLPEFQYAEVRRLIIK